MVVVLVIAGLQFVACRERSEEHDTEHPAEVEPIEGSELSRVTLTEKAMERLDLQTDEIREEQVSQLESPRKVVPYSALIYDPQGNTWIYTSIEPRTFVRHRVAVDFIQGDVAVLKDGPPTGTLIASVGAAELYGTEFGVGH
jgi:hypothetical protein